jgi:hypothetical protein
MGSSSVANGGRRDPPRPAARGGAGRAGCTSRQQPTTSTTTITTTADRPRLTITPGIILTTSRADVCAAGWASKHRRSLTAAQKTAVLKAYGYPVSQKVAEWDHLLPLELGGGNGTGNIWPELSTDAAHEKDLLENKLRWQVCNGGLDLAKAQAEIRQYWRWW